MAAAGAAGKCYASIRCSIPRCSTRDSGAGAGRASASAKEVCFFLLRQAWEAAPRGRPCGFSRIRFPGPRCTRSDSVAGGGRLADAAQEVCFPLVRHYRAVCLGASERSACRPRQRAAKCEAASIRCSIPWCTRSDSGAGGGRLPDAASEVVFFVVLVGRDDTGGREFQGLGKSGIGNHLMKLYDGEEIEIPFEIHRGMITGLVNCPNPPLPFRQISECR